MRQLKQEGTKDTSQSADREGLQILMENRKKFLSFLGRKLNNIDLAEDILQTCFAKIIEKGSCPEDNGDVVPWFYTVLRNAAIDYVRRVDAENRAMTKEAVEQLTKEEIDPEVKDAICACMHGLLPGLKPEYAKIVRDIDLAEGSLSDLAHQEGLSTNNATVRLHRARKALRKELEKSCGICATHGCLECSCRGKSTKV